ncbi:hypothetical protein [Mesobacillus sp. S13]|uniref:hypothetical protein n=1 Tax=Mesobacillus sp. S13 TaxID=2880221 RepID=UPI001CF1F510|nr:hypothetical protein [Mesobacillus sp. S13]
MRKPRSFMERGFLFTGRFAFTEIQFLIGFWVMQMLSFYPNSLRHHFSGNATPLLLPKLASTLLFGQYSSSPFTQIHFDSTFRAMQLLSFYPNLLRQHFSGNAAPLLLPMFNPELIFKKPSPEKQKDKPD